MTPEERISQLPGHNGEEAGREGDWDHEHSDRSDDLSSRESSAEQDTTSDLSDKLQPHHDNGNIVKKPVSEDFVNNNKENEGKQWIMNPLRVSGNLFQDQLSDEDASGKESEDKTSESEEDKSSPGPEDRDLNMNRGQSFMEKNPGGNMDENPLSEQLRAVTERITQLVSEAGNSENPKSLQDLAVLQTTLFTLQQQQLLQMQILAHMQGQGKAPDTSAFPPGQTLFKLNLPDDRKEVGSEPLRKLQDFIGPDNLSTKNVGSKPVLDTSCDIPIGTSSSPEGVLKSQSPYPTPTSSQSTDAFSNTIMKPGDHMDTSPLNSLAMLEQKAQGILNNASHGLLKNSLADLSCKNMSKDDPHFKHRCKFCGKVFGSDSALQIHIR